MVWWDVQELQRLRRSGGHLGAGVPKLSRIAYEISCSTFPIDDANCSLLNSQSQWIVGAFTSWLQPTKKIRRRRWCSVAPPMAKLVFFWKIFSLKQQLSRLRISYLVWCDLLLFYGRRKGIRLPRRVDDFFP